MPMFNKEMLLLSEFYYKVTIISNEQYLSVGIMGVQNKL